VIEKVKESEGNTHAQHTPFSHALYDSIVRYQSNKPNLTNKYIFHPRKQ